MNRWKKMVALLLVIISVLPAGTIVRAAEMAEDPWSGYTFENIPITYRVRGDKYKGKETAQIPYHPGLFLQDANTLSPDLARLGAALSAASYDMDYIYGALEAMGFTTHDEFRATYSRVLTIDDNDYVGFTVAERVVEWQGEEYMVYCVPVRGTAANAEWYSDFNLGDGDVHWGFNLAAMQVYSGLLKCVAENVADYDREHTVIYLTGHSRGAAVANLVAAQLTKDGEVAAARHITAYTFACPAVSKRADESLQNIYNFNNPGDLIPLLPLEKWGYKRNGRTYDSIDGANWSNLCHQFLRMTGETLASESSPDNFLALANDVLPTVETFQAPEVQAVINSFAWILSGGSDTTFAEAIRKSGIYAAEHTLQDLQESMNIANWARNDVDELVAEYDSHIAWLRAREDELREMDAAEFADFLELNADRIAAIQLITEIAITAFPEVAENVEKLESMAAKARFLADKMDNIASLLFDEDGNVMAKIYHGHTDITYVLWMNSLFYGYRGWYGYDGVTMEADVLNNCYSIGDSCFESCAGAFNFPRADNVRFLGNRVCYGASGLRGAVTIPEGVKAVGDYAFYNCWELTELTLSDGVTSVGESAFYFCRSLETVVIPQTVTRIGNQAFSGCTGIAEVTMPAALTFDSTNGSAFYGCKAIARVNLTGAGAMAASVANYTPWGRATGQVSVELEEGITSIPDEAFAGCYSLLEVTIPKSVTRIGARAFSGCSLLERADLPEGLTYLGENAFSSCRGLKTVTFPGTLTTINKGVFSGCSGLNGTLVIPNSVTYVNDNAFNGCSGITEVTMPAALSFSSNNDGAFSGCSAIARVILTGTGAMAASPSNYTPWGRTSVGVTVELEEGITSIPDSAFMQCYRLTRVRLPSSLKSVGRSAFSGCIGLAEVIYHGSESAWSKISFGQYNDLLTQAVLYCNGSRVDTGIMGENKNVRWQYRGETGTLTVTGDVAEAKPVLAAAYENGRMVELKMFTSGNEAQTFSATFDTMMLFWLGDNWMPLCERAEVELH